MKIKKVEISGFRAFDKVEDSIFDFTLGENQIANFISIYAPNGFGKTSFYDAVEWCVTGQIERFHKNASEYTKLAVENRKENSVNPHFLNHHNSVNNSSGYVKVLTDYDAFPKRDVPNSKGYDFKSLGERPYFKDVILSQELIDRFLKEEKAEDRYRNFVESFPDLDSYNIKLQNIIKLFDLNTLQVKNLRRILKEKEKIQLSIDFENDGRVLEEVNNSIQYLVDNKQDLQLINKEFFTDNDYKVLSNKILSKLTSLNIEIEAKLLKLDNIDLVYNGIEGDESLKGIVVYFDNRDKIEVIKNNLDSYKKLSKLIFDFDNNSKQIVKDQDSKSVLLKIKDEFNDYLFVESKIKPINESISALTKSNSSSNDELVLNKKSDSLFESELNRTKLELNAVENKLKKINPTKNRIIECNSSIEKFDKIESIESNIILKEKSIKELNAKIREIDSLLKKIEDNIEIILENELLKNKKEYIQGIIELEKKYTSIKIELDEIIQKIELQETINIDLQEFIKKGLDLVIKYENSICPLCSKEYDSFTDLSEKITNNKSLKKILQKYLSEKTNLETSLVTVKKNINERKEFISKKIQKEKEKLIEIKEILSKDLTQLSESKSQIEKMENEKKELLAFFEGNDFDTFLKQLNGKQKDLNDTILAKNKDKEKLSIKIKGLLDTIDSNNEKIDKEIQKIEQLKHDEKYQNIIKYFNEVFNTDLIEYSLIEEQINAIHKRIEKLTNNNLKIEDEVNKIKSSLKVESISQDEIKTLLKIQDDALLLIQKAILNYEQAIKSDYSIDIKTIDKQEADKLFDNLKGKVKEEKRQLEEILKHFKIIDNLKEQTLSFLVAVKTKNEITELKKQLIAIEKLNKELEAEKSKLQAFLRTKINQFFNTALINKLYQKIDPHPDYEEVKFDCEFKENNPRLQIYIKDKQGNYSVPTLYFSSAQINILSLSIFLARALKAVNLKTNEPIKCIFIDDPIQSMDSINILSIIDLFRSIVINLDRQIILSTHEENFHLLLQKKIPKNLFKSKFIEFETFGKLKKEEVKK